MNTSSLQTQLIEVEWHQLDFRYQYLRMHTHQMQQRLMLSIHTYGLLVPIVLIASMESHNPWIVIDGYLRISAIKALGKDTISASISTLTAAEALIYAYANNKARSWDCLEEARLLHELMSSHYYSQAQLATCFGKSEAWVSHRLQLITSLPEFVKDAVYQGHLSVWPASRLLVPFARANQQHAKQFVDYLIAHTHSSRDIQAFYEHYRRSNKKVREHLVEDPQLFFKSLELSKQNHSSEQLMSSFPEHSWEKKLEQIAHALGFLESIMPAVFYPQQTPQERNALSQPLDQVSITMDALKQSVHRRIHAQTTSHTNSAAVMPSREE